MRRLDAMLSFLRRHRRLLGVVLALLFVPSLAGLAARASYDAVTYGGATMGGDTPLFLASDWTQPHGTIYYAYRAHGEIRIQVGIANNGDLPVRITGLGHDQQWDWTFVQPAIALPPAPTMEVLPLYPVADDRWYGSVFSPFELGPHQATTFALRLPLPYCGNVTDPIPTLAPSASPDASAAFAATEGSTGFDYFPLTYTVDGVAHDAQIHLPATIVIVQSESRPYSCPAV